MGGFEAELITLVGGNGETSIKGLLSFMSSDIICLIS